MPVIDVDKAREWAKERWPSPVVRRQVDFLLTNCPRAKEITVIHCEGCKKAVPSGINIDLFYCTNGETPRTVYFDSTCDDAEKREE